MAQVNAGRVRFVSKGEYNNETQYYIFDLVNYNGSSYYAKENTIGILPTNTTKWQLVAEKGNIGPVGPQGETGNGIVSVTKTSTSGLTDTYTITYTNGNTSTFTVTNGENGEVTQEQLDKVIKNLEYWKTTNNALPKVEAEGTDITLDNTADSPLNLGLKTSDSTQNSTRGVQLFDKNNVNALNASFSSDGKRITTSNNAKTLYTTCDPNTAYVVSKISSSRFRLLTTETIPTLNIQGIDYKENDTGTSITVTTSSNANYLCVYYYLNGTDTLTEQEILDSIQIEEGSTATDYEPYTGGQPTPNPSYPYPVHVVKGDNEIIISNSDSTKEQNYPINLGNLEMCKISTYSDELFKNISECEYYDENLEVGKWYLRKNVKKIIITDENKTLIHSFGTEYGHNRVLITKSRIGAPNNYFSNRTLINTYREITDTQSVSNGVFATNFNSNFIYFWNDDFYSLEVARDMMIGTEIYIIQANSAYTLLSDTLQTQLNNIEYAMAYQDQTNISQINEDRPFIISASTVKDMKTLEDRITALEESISL